MDADLQALLFNRQVPTRTFDGPQIGKVTTVVGSKVTFTVPDFSTTAKFGPAPLPTGVTTTVGATCLVLFVGTGADRPYVIAVYP